jgi:hypothetical protein
MPAWHGILWCPACHLTTSMDVASMAPSPVCVLKKNPRGRRVAAGQRQVLAGSWIGLDTGC